MYSNPFQTNVKDMKKILTLLLVLTVSVFQASAIDVVKGQIPVKSFDVARNNSKLFLSMDFDLSGIKLGKDREITIQPVVYNADSTECVEFEPVMLAGRNLYYKHLRDKDLDGTTMLRPSKSLADYNYTATVADLPWMDNARFGINYTVGGCCATVIDQGYDPLYRLRKVERPTFKPEFNYIVPVGDSVKVRELKKSAFVDFPVNKIVIYPEYRNNTVELGKIIATIDSVRNDKDITITSISIKGFASPEGTYKHNTWLAENRTYALRDYVRDLYHFAPDFIKTSFEPEDWAGLKAYVEKSDINNRDGILALINSDLEPDAKDARIKKTYPVEYQFLLKTVYPALRHSDYKIDYNIRSFTSLEDILRVLREDPSKLSLSEMFRAAQSMEPGSDAYNEVFETAVRIYPTSSVANLNAANAAMSRGDLKSASRYLTKAGEGPEAVYARGICAALGEDYAQAEQFFITAARLKVADAPEALSRVREILNFDSEDHSELIPF